MRLSINVLWFVPGRRISGTLWRLAILVPTPLGKSSIQTRGP